MKPRDQIAEILAIRERGDRTAHFSHAKWRLGDLERQFETSVEPQKLVRAYLPIGIATVIEVFVRASIKQLVDFGAPFAERAEPLARQIKFDFALIKSIEGKVITLGELIAHSVSVNQLNQIAYTFTTLIDEDFFKRLASVVDRWAVEVEKKPPIAIIKNPDEVYSSIGRLFERRHMLVHELPERLDVTTDELRQFFFGAKAFLNAADQLFWDLLSPGAPLTQTGMNIESGRKLAARTKELAEFVDARALDLEKDGQSERANLLREAQGCWQLFADADSQFQASLYKGGTIWSMMRSSAATALTQSRLADLTKFFEAEGQL